MGKTVLGVIGGSGFYQMKALTAVEQVELTTPFGRPSDPFYRGTLGDCDVVFLCAPRPRPSLMPTELNYRANVYGMKLLGVDHLVSVSTAGSMKEDIAAGRPAWSPTSFIDHTYKRPATFFRRRNRRACLACRSGMRGARARSGRGGRRSRRDGSSTAASISASRGRSSPARAESNLYRQLGCRRYQYDRDAGGAARARSRALLRGAGAGDRLRLLASRACGGRYRRDSAR